MSSNRRIQLSLTGPEWEPLFAYAESQNIKPVQAVSELLLASLATNATSAAYMAASRRARIELSKFMIGEAMHAVNVIGQRVQQRAIELGVEFDADRAAS